MTGAIEKYKERLMLRRQEIGSHPEVIRRLNIIAINTALQADIYGNGNSTHVMGTDMMSGIGASGDFARNGWPAIFATKSIAKGGRIFSIVPMVSHVDHCVAAPYRQMLNDYEAAANPCGGYTPHGPEQGHRTGVFTPPESCWSRRR